MRVINTIVAIFCIQVCSAQVIVKDTLPYWDCKYYSYFMGVEIVTKIYSNYDYERIKSTKSLEEYDAIDKKYNHIYTNNLVCLDHDTHLNVLDSISIEIGGKSYYFTQPITRYAIDLKDLESINMTARNIPEIYKLNEETYRLSIYDKSDNKIHDEAVKFGAISKALLAKLEEGTRVRIQITNLFEHPDTFEMDIDVHK